MSAQNTVRRISVPEVIARKGGEPLVVLTAYDAPTAAIIDPHVDMILVGDSLGMVVHGLASTVGVTLEMMILHGQAVMRGASHALVVVDLPFGSYEASPEQAFHSAARVMAETGCQAIKIESGTYAAATVGYLAERGIPVMAHVGLRPQAVHMLGGFASRGKTEADRHEILQAARAVDAAGAFSIVIEGVAEDLATEITSQVRAPTIGIGASVLCDGQVLVTNDMLGQFERVPRFVKKYGDQRGDVDRAVAAYAADVRARRFPTPEHVYAARR